MLYYYQKGEKVMRDYFKIIRCRGKYLRYERKNGTVRATAKRELAREVKRYG